MRNKSLNASLIETNPYLRDIKKRWEYIITSVTSSSMVEGIHIDSRDILNEYEKRIGSLSPDEKSLVKQRLVRLGR